MTTPRDAVLLVAHGTVDDLDDLPAFLAAIRRGHAPPDELVQEVRRRYEAIGGQSPLNATCEALATKLEATLGLPTRYAARLWRPTVDDRLRALAEAGARRVRVVALAQYSSQVYEDAVTEANARLGLGLEVVAAPDWGTHPGLVDAYARRLVDALEGLDPARTKLLVSAHSLPVAVVAAGDRYEARFREAAAAVVARAEALAPGRVPAHAVVFQSQGMSKGPGGRPVAWLGPDLPSALEETRGEGKVHVLVAPVGFLADHVEVLYDLDLEAKHQARALGLALTRTRSLDASDDLVEVLADLARGLAA